MIELNIGLLVTILAVIVALSSMTITVIISKYRKDQIRWEQESEDNFRKGKEEASDIIRMTIDKIQDDKIKLVALTEKELMIETMIALGGYGRRIDRIEEKIQFITNYKVYIEDMNKQLRSLSDTYVSLQKDIKDVESFVCTFNGMIQETTSRINEFNDNISDVGNIKQKVDKLVENLNKTVNMLESMNDQVANIVKNMNGVFETYGDAPMVKLMSIDATISEISDTIVNLVDFMGGFDGNMSDVRSKLDEALDQYSSYSIYGKIEKLQDDLGSVKTIVGESLDQYGYCSVYNKIEELGNRIGN